MRFSHIYKITNTITEKSYIGQTVCMVHNHGKLRPYGYLKRFKAHISEAFSTKRCQCTYLNNAIRKYGKCAFNVECIETCIHDDASAREIHMIQYHNTMHPHGYNLTCGGESHHYTNESKKRISNGVKRFFQQKKIQRFTERLTQKELCDFKECIHPLRRDNRQYGWYILIGKAKADFGGVHAGLYTSLLESKEFYDKIKCCLAKRLVAGNS